MCKSSQKKQYILVSEHAAHTEYSLAHVVERNKTRRKNEVSKLHWTSVLQSRSTRVCKTQIGLRPKHHLLSHLEEATGALRSGRILLSRERFWLQKLQRHENAETIQELTLGEFHMMLLSRH